MLPVRFIVNGNASVVRGNQVPSRIGRLVILVRYRHQWSAHSLVWLSDLGVISLLIDAHAGEKLA
jgi:hypothetical protein